MSTVLDPAAPPVTAPATPPATPPVTPPVDAPWYASLEPDIKGRVEMKGWAAKTKDEAFIEAVKYGAAAEKQLGVPPNELVRWPKDIADEDGWRRVNERLGVPPDASMYDLSEVKGADGKVLEGPLADAIRKAAHEAKVPKDNIAPIARGILSHFEAQEAQRLAGEQTALLEEKRKLADNWGANSDVNVIVARRGAAKLGFDENIVAALEKASNYSTVMEALRKAGEITGEAKFLGGNTDSPAAFTRESAQAEIKTLQSDKDFAKRLMAGEATARAKWDQLNRVAAGLPAQ